MVICILYAAAVVFVTLYGILRQRQTDRYRESTIQWGTAKPRGYVSESKYISIISHGGINPIIMCIFAA